MSTPSLAELQQKTLQSQSELSSLESQIAALKRNVQVAELSQQQMHSELGSKKNVWKSVGKMFLSVPVEDYDKDVKAREAEVTDQIGALEKKRASHTATLNNLTKAMNYVKTND